MKLLARDRVGQDDGEVGQLSGPKHLGVGGTDRVVRVAMLLMVTDPPIRILTIIYIYVCF